MQVSEIIQKKREKKDSLKQEYKLPKKFKPLGIIDLQNEDLTWKLIEWLSHLPVNFIVIWKNNDSSKYNNIVNENDLSGEKLFWIDFIIWNWDENIKKYFKYGIAPVILSTSECGKTLSEYDPIQNEWDSYQYDKSNEWDIFYALVRYLENYKFPMDNRNIVKNIIEK